MYDVPLTPGQWRQLSPMTLTWDEVDPGRHPFDPGQAAAVIRRLPPAQDVPVRPEGHAALEEIIRWSQGQGANWADAMSQALIGHYGRWAAGWRWSVGEADIDGGPVTGWCCPRDSMTTPEATLDVVVACLLEWRAWLEELRDRFGRFLPLPDGDDAVLDVWERAVAHLVTVVAERTGAESGWYGHCEQVLGWYLAAAGIPAPRHDGLIAGAIGGRFHSWVEPEPDLVSEVAADVAAAVLADRAG